MQVSDLDFTQLIKKNYAHGINNNGGIIDFVHNS